MGDRASQLKKLRCGNQWIALAKRKITARRSGYCAGQKKNCGTAINGLHPPKEQNSGAAIRVSRLPLQNLRRSNQGIAPAKRKIAARQSMDCAGQKNKIAARQSGYGACLFKICGAAIRVSSLPLQNLRKAWVLCQMVGARLENHAKGWREA